jgi:3-oxoacyl-[acyl-carrier protein] reductase
LASGEAVAVNGSVTDQAFPDRFVGAAMEKFGGLDAIVNNAGYTWDSAIQK